MPDLSQVTFCGLYCGLCAQRNRIPRQAGALRESMRKEGWDQWGAVLVTLRKEIPSFEEFWSFLTWLAESEAGCSCRDGKCGPPFCGIRKCARERKIVACPNCDEYPCQRIEGLAKGYVTILADGKRMLEIGLERWIAEQEDRRATGFSYVDIRNHPYSVPTE